MGKRTARENLDEAMGWFFGAIGGYAMLRFIDVARERRAQVPPSVRVTIQAPPLGTPVVGSSGDVVEAEFVETPRSRG